MIGSHSKRRYFQFLFAMAWSDGEFQTTERVFLERLLAATELSEDEARVIAVWFDQAPDEPDWDALTGDFAYRERLMRQLLVLAASDRTMALKEMALLGRLRQSLQFSDEEYFQMVDDVEQLLATSSGSP
ncbi:MAG: TerB family tellurite resistance protein [Bradymonadaceae bacterium]|nr:TerB family tellurite resistance protein [Lujinxingiaceae bacterium]